MNRDLSAIPLQPHHSQSRDEIEVSARSGRESNDEKRSTILELPPVPDSGIVQHAETSTDVETRVAAPFRPLSRPPMAVLCALDDGRDRDGETWRVRKSEFVVGRIQGDAVIPHDRDISARHAEVGYRWQDGCFRWFLRDLGSTNGTFIRVSRIVLKTGQQIILGSRRYQFLEVGQSGECDEMQDEASLRETRDYRPPEGNLPFQTNPRLIEVNAADSALSFTVSNMGGYVGADSHRCAIVIPEDPFIDPVHARVFRDTQGRCVMEDCRSRNGLWLRVQNVELSGTTGFQLGEQRFTIAIL